MPQLQECLDNEKSLTHFVTMLSSPSQNEQLELLASSEINLGEWKKIPATGLEVGDYGMGDKENFLRSTSGRLYPVVDGFPVLLEPEALIPENDDSTISLKQPQYEEAYTEMQHYNAGGAHRDVELADERIAALMGELKPGDSAIPIFPDPAKLWIDAQHDSLSQYEAYKYLSDIMGKRFAQLGGTGVHCVKALLAGANEAVLLTPMLGEAQFAKSLAEKFGVADRLYCVIGVGEELPFKENTIDLLYSGGCLHHMNTQLAMCEFKRVLAPKGRFACVDPWKTHLHRIGTKLLGKREAGVFCRPIDTERLQAVSEFEDHVVIHNGPVLRYVLLGLSKFGLNLPPVWMMSITKVENSIFRKLGLGNSGGSLMIAGQK